MGDIQSMPQDLVEGRITQIVFPAGRGVALKAISDEALNGYGAPFIDPETGDLVNDPMGTIGGSPADQLFRHANELDQNDYTLRYGASIEYAWPHWRKTRTGANDTVYGADGLYNGNTIPNMEIATFPYKQQVSGYATPTIKQKVYVGDGGVTQIYQNGKAFLSIALFNWGINEAGTITGFGIRTINSLGIDEDWVYFLFYRANFYGADEHQVGMGRVNLSAPTLAGRYDVLYLAPAPFKVDQTHPAQPGPPTFFNSSCTEACFVSDAPYPTTGALSQQPDKYGAVFAILTVLKTSWTWAQGRIGYKRTVASGEKIADDDEDPQSVTTLSNRTQTQIVPVGVGYDGDTRIELTWNYTEINNTTGAAGQGVGSSVSLTTLTEELVWSSGQRLITRSRVFDQTLTSGGSGATLTFSLTDNRTMVFWVDAVTGYWAGAKYLLAQTNTMNGTLLTGSTVDNNFFVTTAEGESLFGKYGDILQRQNKVSPLVLRDDVDYIGANTFELIPEIGPSSSQSFETNIATNLEVALRALRLLSTIFTFGEVSVTGYYMGSSVFPSMVVDINGDHAFYAGRGYDSDAFSGTYERLEGESNFTDADGNFPPEYQTTGFQTTVPISLWDNGDLVDEVFQSVTGTNRRVNVLGVA